MTDLLSALTEARKALKLADLCLDEATAILGGEYGDHYGVLAELMARLTNSLPDLLSRIDSALAQGGEREALQEGRDHLTVTGKFQSDKYPWCHAGFVPLKTSDPMAADLLAEYALRRAPIDREFWRDLMEALLPSSPNPQGENR